MKQVRAPKVFLTHHPKGQKDVFVTTVGVCNGNISVIMIKNGVVEAYEPINDCLSKIAVSKLPVFDIDF